MGKINYTMLQKQLNQFLVKLCLFHFLFNLFQRTFIKRKLLCLFLYINPHFCSIHSMYFGIPEQIYCIVNENITFCVSFCLRLIGRKGTELQQRRHPLSLFAHLHYGYHHAMLPPQCLLQPGQPGSRLLWHCVLHPLPPAHFLLCLARLHHKGHEDPGGGCQSSASPSNKGACFNFKHAIIHMHSNYLLRIFST